MTESEKQLKVLKEIAEAAKFVYYGPSSGYVAVRNWKRLGEALAGLEEQA